MTAPKDEAISDSPIQVRVAALPSGVPDETVWNYTQDPTPEPAEGEVTLRLEYLSVDVRYDRSTPISHRSRSRWVVWG